MKIALIYGYAEGPRIAATFISSLRRLGHELVDASDAEVIVAHSGGSYLIPNKNNAKLILLVDVPYYDSHTSLMKKLYKRVTEEGWSLKSISKFGWNNWYVVSKPKRCFQMYKAVIDGTFQGLDGNKVVFVRNTKDIFGVVAQDKKEAKKIKGKVEELPGIHDDLWIHPEPYIKLAEKIL
jgi:hypothetical protein